MRNKWLVLVLAGISITLSAAYAQEISATLFGFVTDPQGLAVPSATITITNTGTGLQRVLTSDQRGAFIASHLPSGDYRIRAEAPGFRVFEQSGIVLHVSQEVRSDVHLVVGNTTQTVQVTASATLVDTNSASMEVTADNKFLIEMGSIYNVIYLTPGVGTNSYLTRSINGGRPEQESIQLDGGDFFQHVASGTNPQNTYPPPDALQDFTILTNDFKAEHGIGGVVINATTKSGTNRFHGTAWESVSNNILNARSYFSKTVPKLRNNQPGGDIGGPILKNRLFFYGMYNGYRNIGATSQTVATVPTALERAGDFSQSSKKPTDPTTGSPFTNNQIPTGRINSVATKWLSPSIVPLPTLNGNQLPFIVPGSTNRDQMLIKLDAYIRKRHNLTVKLMQTFGSRGISSGPLPTLTRITSNGDEEASIDWVLTASPTLVNELRFNTDRIVQNSQPSTQTATAADLGLTYHPASPNMPDLTMSGYSEMGRYQGRMVQTMNSFQWMDNLTKYYGRHAMKFGVQAERIQFNFLSEFFSAGGYSFSGTFTGNPAADMLLGMPSSFSENSVSLGYPRNEIYSFFAQDDFKVSKRLTLNLGLRYDLQPWPSSANNVGLVGFNLANYRAGIVSKVYPTAPPGLIFIGDLGDTSASLFGGTRYHKAAPRVGFAYDLTGDGRTSLRGGYGITFEPNQLDRYAQIQTPPFMLSMGISAPQSFANPYLNQPNGDPFPYTPGPKFNFATVEPLGMNLGPKDSTSPYIQQWNLSLQRELFRNVLLQVAYVGNHAVHLISQIQGNPAVYIPGTNAQGQPLSTLANTNARRLYAPYYASFNLTPTAASASYNALQIFLNKRASKGLTLLSSYTYSHVIDTETSSYGDIQIPFNFKADRASSAMDFRHGWSVGFVWMIPKAPIHQNVLNYIVNGWQLNGRNTLQTGNPINIATGTDNSLTGMNADRPNQVLANPYNRGLTKGQEYLHYININAYTPNATGTFGTLGRNTIIGPGLWTSSATVVRIFPFHEGHQRLEFRWGMSNPFNHINLTSPTGWSLSGASSFGVLNVSSPRSMTMQMKFYF